MTNIQICLDNTDADTNEFTQHIHVGREKCQCDRIVYQQWLFPLIIIILTGATRSMLFSRQRTQHLNNGHFRIPAKKITKINFVGFHICDPSARNQSHVGRVRFSLRAEMHGGHITDSCFIAFITSKRC